MRPQIRQRNASIRQRSVVGTWFFECALRAAARTHPPIGCRHAKCIDKQYYETKPFLDAGYTTTEWYQRTVVDRYECDHLQYDRSHLEPDHTNDEALGCDVGNAATPATTYRRLSDSGSRWHRRRRVVAPNTNAAYMH